MWGILKTLIILILWKFKVCNAEYIYIGNSTVTGHGFGPFYLATTSIEKCESKLDQEHAITMNIRVHKTSRTDEEFLGNVTVPKKTKIVKAMVEFKRLYDGGYKTDYKKFMNKPCEYFAFNIILLKYYHPDKDCNFKKGVYSLDGLNPNYIMHSIFPTYHYSRYIFIFDWFTERGSVGCFKFMCSIQPLRKPKPKRKKT